MKRLPSLEIAPKAAPPPPVYPDPAPPPPPPPKPKPVERSPSPTDKNMRRLAHDREVSAIAVKGNWLFTASADTTVKQWDTETGACVGYYAGNSLAITSLCMGPGNTLITGGYDTIANQWEIQDGPKAQGEPAQGVLLASFVGHSRAITAVAIKGDFLYTASADKHVREWDFNSKECTLILAAHGDAVTSLSYTEEGLISGSSDTTAKRWSLAGPGKGSVNMTYQGHSDSVNAVTAGGGRVYTGSSDRTIREWDSESGESLRLFYGHTADVRTIFLRPNGRGLLTGGGDDTARSWDLDSGACSLKYLGHSFRVSSVVEHNGSIFTGSWDYCVRRWSEDGASEMSYTEGRTRWERCRVWSAGDSPQNHYGYNEHRLERHNSPQRSIAGRGPSPIRGMDRR